MKEKDLFSDLPFNLSGQLIDNSVTSEGDARLRALAESEARNAQRLLDIQTLSDAPSDLPLNDKEQAALYREARKAQERFEWIEAELNNREVDDFLEERYRSEFECGGTFDGFSCGSDADSGL